MHNRYALNQLVRIETDPGFRDINGALVDPPVVILWVQRPGGSKTSHRYGTDPGVIRDSVGKYHYDQAATTPKVWKYRWEGQDNSGVTLAASDDMTFDVAASTFYTP